MTSDSFAAVIKEFKQLLRQIFRLDGTGDLDFGIYRVINEKANFLRDFIGGLDGVVEAALVRAGGDREAAQKKLRKMAEEIKKTLEPTAIDDNGNLVKYTDTEVGKEYIAAQKRAGGIAVPNLEADICNHLLRFFERCYRDGDFMPQRKISNRGVYSLPYNGEDVFLHWANRGQYYIKTSENFSSYGFTVPGETAPVRVCFVVCEAADMPDNNNKGGRSYFFPQIADMAFVGNELRVPIHYRAPNDKDKLDDGKKPLQKPQHVINAKAAAEAEKIIPADFPQANGALKPDGDASADADAPKTVFHQKLNHYTRRHETDFFIHKNLREFLLRELESSVKNEVINLDEIQADNLPLAEARLISARAILDIGGKIIAHLAQFEDFQKTLWEKKKFITETNYIVRLGAAMESKSLSAKQKEAVLAEVCKGEAQWEEWRKLNLLGEDSAALFANNKKTRDKARRAVLSACLSLPLDTAHFGGATGDVALSLLSAFDDLEEATDGVLFHGENWQALNLLQGKYRGAVNCVYIDPPYNTDASAIIYKNDYKDSSWLSLMFDRLSSAKEFLTAEGILCCAIDDVEVWRLRAIMESVFENEIGIAPVRSNPAGRKSSGQFSPAHEYALFYGNEESVPGNLVKTEKEKASYPLEDSRGRFVWTNLVRSGTNDRREDAPRLYYPIFVNDKNQIRIPKMEWDEKIREWIPKESEMKNEVVIYPFRENGGAYEGNWHRGHLRLMSEPEEYRARKDSKGKIKIEFKKRMDENSLPKTWWGEGAYSSANGTIALNNVMGGRQFDFPKSIRLVMDCLLAAGAGDTDSRVLDFFAGSGTTGHAVVNLNREDGGRRKFILAEMGDYFDRVLLRRLKKIVFAPDWKDGKPANQPSAAAVARGPRVLKYHRLESYEDALDNVEFAEVDKADLKLFGAEFQHRYMLRWESSGSATFAPGGLLDSPFTYALPRAGKDKVAHADLPETFYYMAGIRIQSREATKDSGRRYQIDLGDYHGEPSAFIWRDCANWTPEDCDRERKFFAARKDLQGRRLYVNGGHLSENLRHISPIFNTLMFGDTDSDS